MGTAGVEPTNQWTRDGRFREHGYGGQTKLNEVLSKPSHLAAAWAQDIPYETETYPKEDQQHENENRP